MTAVALVAGVLLLAGVGTVLWWVVDSLDDGSEL